ncbi:hypothetical protein [Rivularia sp. UHCC 0363]|uniref:hypothetical protein n=1 Tax=Rivularia sp. UHCC 0363 TaxID=3110244 RepID=UPI002B20BE1E|nr:hypothetical protein [Rivularia sp. UHCC 0363]MEA5593761.1 hypothetical protein [Rivularia sp. UHCC 0363]
MRNNLNLKTVVQNRIGSVIRFMMTSSVACFTATLSNWMDYQYYWNGTIYRTQTVDFNILSHTLPTKLSYALQKKDLDELQETLNSSYGFFGLVVTDCRIEEKNCLNQKILYSTKSYRSWKTQLKPEDLLLYPYDLLRNPPPLLTESKYDSPRTEERTDTGKENAGRIIGRVYYIRGISPSFLEDYQRWVKKPLSTSGAHKDYSLTMALFLVGGFASWIIIEFLIYKRKIQEQLHQNKLEHTDKQYKKLLYQFKQELKRNQNKQEEVSLQLPDQQRKIDELHHHNQILIQRISKLNNDLNSQSSNQNNKLEELKLLKKQLLESQQRESEAKNNVNNFYSLINDLKQREKSNIQRIKTLEQQSSQLKNLNASLITLEPNGQDLDITQLRDELGMENILNEGVIKSIFYRDRYLFGKGASILANILTGNWLKSTSYIKIKVLEKDNTPAHLRKYELENCLNQFTNKGIIVKVEVQPLSCRDYFDHARLLEIERTDGQKYQIIFDQGMDFIQFNLSSNTYSIKTPTYLTIIKQN